jgi:DNA replication protein DnaD
MKDKVIYCLATDDIQNVAKEEVGRNLSSVEIDKITATIEENINWYEVIARALIVNQIKSEIDNTEI